VSDGDLTLHQAAEALGVHYMTAYRYVRLGVLPARKVGGTWRVSSADLGLVSEPNPAATSEGVTPRRRAPWSARLEARLVAGDARGAWTVIESAMAAGAGIDEVYLDVLSPAMRRIGARWADGELDIAVEHRATGIAFRLIGRLGPRLARRGRTRGVVVVGAPPGERHSLPIAMLADLVRADGWEVSDIGADLPVESFVQAAAGTADLVAVGVSVTSSEHLAAAAELLRALRAELPDTLLVAGGAAVRDTAHARELGATEWAATPAAFTALLSNAGESDQPVVAVDH
jgi:excisionase family DNA binding protein